MEWILASASPRRKQLLKDLIEEFEIRPATGEEKVDRTLSPAKQCLSLARQKAREVYEATNGSKYVLGSDTVVAIEGQVLGKPKDEADAKRMLSLLSGRTHEVFTGVCMIAPSGREIAEVASTQVRFSSLTESFIDGYVKSGSPMDKAGAYGIQDGGLVEEIVGSYSNVVGLPQELCKKMLVKITSTEEEE
ncbi:MAG: septum formation protein Maf [Clostridia bacterium]|nr:septum formation protein Maf [Clostridia bacterium]